MTEGRVDAVELLALAAVLVVDAVVAVTLSFVIPWWAALLPVIASWILGVVLMRRDFFPPSNRAR